jgi:hypothetical protein
MAKKYHVWSRDQNFKENLPLTSTATERDGKKPSNCHAFTISRHPRLQHPAVAPSEDDGHKTFD